MRRFQLLVLCLLATLPVGAQVVIDPGMPKAQVIARLGKPAQERTAGGSTYLFYANDCGRSCGMNDIVVLEADAVADAIFRSARRRYSGASSSPRAISAAEARRATATPPAAASGGEGQVVASISISGTKQASLFERIGGLPAVRAAVHEMVSNAMADARIKAFFVGVDMERVDRNLVDFVCKAAGGPCAYSGKSMPAAHEGLNLGVTHFNALLDDLKQGLDKLKVPSAEQQELLAAMSATRKDVLGK